nr:hypothetical protein [uncultured Friedmanniella sp.]
MAQIHKVCSPFVPGTGSSGKGGSRTSSEQLAASERVDNVRVIPATELLGRASSARPPGVPVFSATFWTTRLWENGKTLRVRFLDGDPAVQAKVEAIAHEWEAEANLTLEFVASGPAEIRISFAEKGFSWSAVGTDAGTAATGEPTMNYGWLEPGTGTREYQRVVRHEFGHALGMIHEHQNPTAAIPWDRSKVYAHYARQGWSRADVDFNLFQIFGEDSTNHTSFDPLSIMQYAVPDSLTIGSYAIGWNTELSQLDREFMRLQYPRRAPGLVELTPDGPPVAADLAASGEVDTYHFAVGVAATQILTTKGPSDTVLTLHGPNDPGAVLAWDDDRGQGPNARIVRKLAAGDYWLSVRHKDPAARGAYTVQVRTRR